MEQFDAGERASLNEQIETLRDELEAARIERDQARATTKVMAQALEQMSQLLHPHPDGEAPER